MLVIKLQYIQLNFNVSADFENFVSNLTAVSLLI